MPQQFSDEVLYDVRLIERHVARGLLTWDEVKKHQESTPDLTEQADKLDLDQLSRPRSAKRSQG